MNLFVVSILISLFANTLCDYSQQFENVLGLYTAEDGWIEHQNSNPVGISNSFQGNAAVFTGFTGSYMGMNFQSTGNLGTISLWSVSPIITAGLNGTFYTRCVDTTYPDRLEIRYSAGRGSDVGTTATSVGTFTNLLLSVNPNLVVNVYPTTWTKYSFTIPSNIVVGRMAFRYFVTNGGASGDNSDYIGIDQLNIVTGCAAIFGNVDVGTHTVYNAATSCDTTCTSIQGSITCASDRTLTGDTTFNYTSCTPSLTYVCEVGTSGDPHFYGFKGQKVTEFKGDNLICKYDVMGQSYEIYNIITAPQLQINSRFIPYYKKSRQVVPTGTMMGELGIKFPEHEFQIKSNETYAIFDGALLDLTASWSEIFGNVVLSNEKGAKHKYSISIETKDFKITFIRKVYLVSGLEPQWHFDYKAKLLSGGEDLHGLLGQTSMYKNFAEKKGSAFQWLDGVEENYRIVTNNILGDTFTFNRYQGQ